jgi:3-oxo-5-alpha-steroid 4-dehydrogenase
MTDDSTSSTSTPMWMLQQHVICIWDSISCIGYMIMTIMIYSSYFIPSLNDLASHGKTRMNSNSNSPPKATMTTNEQQQFIAPANHNSNGSKSSDPDASTPSTSSTDTKLPSPLVVKQTTGNVNVNNNHHQTDNRSFLHKCSNLVTSALHYFNHNEIFLVKKKYFRQFYMMGIIYLTTVLYIDTQMKTASSALDPTLPRPQSALPVLSSVSSLAKVSIVLLYIHLFRRLYECTYVHVWNETSKMHIAGYFVGLIHYIWLPHVFIRLPCSKICCSSTNESQYLPLLRIVHFIPQWFDEQSVLQSQLGWMNMKTTSTTTSRFAWTTEQIQRFIFPIVLCLYGQYQQYRHHVLLSNLRKHKTNTNGQSAATKTKASTTSNNSQNGVINGRGESTAKHSSSNTSSTSKSYSLPTSGWFQYVTCPHYLAEIIIYISFALILEEEKHTIWQNASNSNTYYYGYRHVIVVLWVASNLIMSALINHAWYIKNLSDTTAHKVHTKKAILPFLL